MDDKQIPHPILQIADHVPSQAGHGASADAKGLAAEPGHGPQEKPGGHGNGLTGTDCAVAYNGIEPFIVLLIPPAQRQFLFGAEGMKFHDHPPLRMLPKFLAWPHIRRSQRR